MNNFAYIQASSAEETLDALNGDGVSRVLAGGTDLIPLMKEEIVSANTLVDITKWRELRGIASTPEGLHIGALTPLSEIAEHEAVRRDYATLAEACRLAATPQLRNMGTIGGNLLQDTRCWYYRGPYDCWLKGGEVCYARGGENEYHSVFLTAPSESQCVSAHPSDPAAALLALEARVHVRHTEAEAEMPIGELYALPTEARRSFVTLPAGSIITGVTLPPSAPGTKSVYVKAMARATWAFALAGLAMRVQLQDGAIGEARVALSGVAPIPLRVAALEEALLGGRVGSLDRDKLGDVLVEGARPLSHNGYKVTLLRGVLGQALDGLNL